MESVREFVGCCEHCDKMDFAQVRLIYSSKIPVFDQVLEKKILAKFEKLFKMQSTHEKIL